LGLDFHVDQGGIRKVRVIVLCRLVSMSLLLLPFLGTTTALRSARSLLLLLLSVRLTRRTCLRLLLLWAIRGVGTLALYSGQFSCALINWSIGALILLLDCCSNVAKHERCCKVCALQIKLRNGIPFRRKGWMQVIIKLASCQEASGNL